MAKKQKKVKTKPVDEWTMDELTTASAPADERLSGLLRERLGRTELADLAALSPDELSQTVQEALLMYKTGMSQRR